jgi:two-component system cell cycle sensor histidine kinase/response regulator CckA
MGANGRLQNEWLLFQQSSEGLQLADNGAFQSFNRLLVPLTVKVNQIRRLNILGNTQLLSSIEEERARGIWRIRALFGFLAFIIVGISWQHLRATGRAMEAEQVARKLRQSEERFALAVAGANEGIWDWDIATDETYRSQRWYALLGYDSHEMKSTLDSWKTLVHPDDIDQSTDALQSHLNQHEPYDNEYRMRTKSGEYRWFRTRGQAIWDDQDRPVRMTGSISDVSELRSALRSRLELAAFMESSTDGVIRTDLDGVVQGWSKGAEEIFGYSEEEAKGMYVRDFVPPELSDEFRKGIRKLERGQTISFPDTIRLRKDGERIRVSVTGQAILDEKGNMTGTGAIVRDVTSQRKLEESFQQAQRMETVGRLAGGVAHDFNNILTVITGHGSLLKESLASRSSDASGVDAVLRAAQSGSVLTRQLLAFSRKQRHEDRVVNLNDSLSDLKRVLRQTLREDIRLVIELQSSWNVKVDPAQLEQIILNLTMNAQDAMPNGGLLTINTSDFTYSDDAVGTKDPFVSTTDVMTPGPYVRLTFADTGVGMDVDTMAHVFEPFYTTKERGKGTGLGLSAAYGIVTQAGGSILIESEVDQGSCFSVLLPRTDEVPEETEPTFEISSTSGKGSVLLVEDDADVRSLASEILEQAGYTVLAAPTGVEALDKHGTARVDLILTDVIMPEMSGPEFVEKWKVGHPNAAVLYMSGYVDESLARYDISENEFIAKPFKPRDLLQRVASRLEEETTS